MAQSLQPTSLEVECLYTILKAGKMTNEYGLQEVLEIELLMLKELDRVCRKLDISYMLDSGTLIGAVREHGLIPWDDDVDISMTRSNFDRFLSEAPAELSDGFELHTPSDYARDGAFHDFTARLIYTPYTRALANEGKDYLGGKMNHLWIDLFVFDKIPDNTFSAKITEINHKLLYVLSMGHRNPENLHCTKAQQIVLSPLMWIGKLIPITTLCKWKTDYSAKDKDKNYKTWFASNYQPDWLHKRIDSSWIEKTVELPFEDITLPCPAGYHDILTSWYGDYMQRPPIEKRCPAHGADEDSQ